MFGFGMSKSKSKSETSSSSNQQVFMQDMFKKLYGDAANVAANIDTSGMTQTANDLFQSGSNFLGGLEDIAAGTDESSNFYRNAMTGDDGLMNDQISGLQQDLGQFFNEQLLPGINTEAVGGGALGGGRQGVAQTGAMQTVADEFRRGSLDIRERDAARRMEAAGALQTGKLDASKLGMAGLAQQADLAGAAAMAPLSPYLALAEIYGDKSTLTSSQSSGSSTAKSFSFNVSGGTGG
jgi:hypothetical protein